MDITNSSSLNIWNLISTLHPNQASFITTGIQIFATFITVVFTAWVTIKTAFGQARKQFEHKIIYEGWRDVQRRLFDLSEAISNFSAEIMWLDYFLDNQDNSLVNGQNKEVYRQKKWDELNDSYYGNLHKKYIKFLVAFGTNEILFIQLKKMKDIFVDEFEQRISEATMDFFKKIFPEMYGFEKSHNIDELKKEIKSFWGNIFEFVNYIDDFRIELQNETIGKVMERKLERRKANKGLKILTRRGFIIQK